MRYNKMLMEITNFEWGISKKRDNLIKHGVSFSEVQEAFYDPHRIMAEDAEHSEREERYYCFGKVQRGILTVRVIYREVKIRIIGAGFWRKEGKIYEEENS